MVEVLLDDQFALGPDLVETLTVGVRHDTVGVTMDDEGRTLVALCNWENPVMTYADYEWLMFCVKQAKLDVTEVYLFSAGNFDLELKQEGMIKDNVRLIDGSQL